MKNSLLLSCLMISSIFSGTSNLQGAALLNCTYAEAIEWSAESILLGAEISEYECGCPCGCGGKKKKESSSQNS